MGKKKQPQSALCPPPSALGSSRPTWAEVDLQAIVENYLALDSLLARNPGSRYPRLIPVIKADAYGHGAIRAAQALSAAGAEAFAVAIVEEGIELRRAGVKQEILVLEGAWPGQEKDALLHGFTLALFSPETADRLEAAARELSVSALVHLKVDTGMSRLGIRWNSVVPLIEKLQQCSNLRLTGTFSHLACAEGGAQEFTLEQIRRFGEALSTMQTCGMDPGEIHLANSAGLLNHESLRGWSARPGIALYGYPPCPATVKFRPALTLKTRIGNIHGVEPGESVGYNRRFIAKRPCTAGTLPIGYADGFRREFTGKGKVIVSNSWAPLLGAVSMDLIVIELTDLPQAKPGDEVILLGSSADCSFTAEHWATLLGTISYEVLCGISPRVPRIYLEPMHRKG